MGERPLSEEEYRAAEGFTAEDESGEKDNPRTLEEELANLETGAQAEDDKALATEVEARITDQEIATQVESDAPGNINAQELEVTQDAEREQLEEEYNVMLKGIQALGSTRKNLQPEIKALANEIGLARKKVYAGNDKGEYARFFIWATAKMKEFFNNHPEVSNT